MLLLFQRTSITTFAPTLPKQCITAQLREVLVLRCPKCSLFIALILTDLTVIPSAQICFSLQFITQCFSAFCNVQTPEGIFQGGAESYQPA